MSDINLPFNTLKHNNWVNSFTIDQLRRLAPLIVYDIGPGDGFYGKLLKFIDPNIKVFGVELNLKWVTHCRNLNIYEEVIHSDAYNFLENCNGGDLIIFGDILEHMTKDNMIKSLNRSIKKFKYVLINGPIGFQPQDHADVEEIHRCGITKEEDLMIYNIIEYNESNDLMMNCLIGGLV